MQFRSLSIQPKSTLLDYYLVFEAQPRIIQHVDRFFSLFAPSEDDDVLIIYRCFDEVEIPLYTDLHGCRCGSVRNVLEQEEASFA